MLVDEVGAQMEFRQKYNRHVSEGSKAPLAWTIRDMWDWPGFDTQSSDEMFLFVCNALELRHLPAKTLVGRFLEEMEHYRYQGLPGERYLEQFHSSLEAARARLTEFVLRLFA